MADKFRSFHDNISISPPHFCMCIHEIFSRIKIINLSKITCVELAATLLECPLKNALLIFLKVGSLAICFYFTFHFFLSVLMFMHPFASIGFNFYHNYPNIPVYVYLCLCMLSYSCGGGEDSRKFFFPSTT